MIGKVIDPAQSGFIPGREMADNILLAVELIKGYSRKNNSPRCMIKMDLRKAYASINWVFLFSVMEEMSFPPKFMDWIRPCVTTVSYSILVNGTPLKIFPAKRATPRRSHFPLFICHCNGVLVQAYAQYD